MPFTKAVFNKEGRWHWWFGKDDIELDLHLRSSDLTETWFVAELFHPELPDYDTSMHDHQIEKLLSEPGELVEFVPSEKLKQSILELEK